MTTRRTRRAPLGVPPVLGPRPRPAHVRLAPAQERMWSATPSADWNVARAMRLRGSSVEVAALAAAVELLVARHDPLRTRYPATEFGPAQRVVEPAEVVLDLVRCAMREEELGPALAALAAQPFDLAQDLPVRARLFVLGPDDVVLALVVHHISLDGRSMAPLIRDLITAYGACRTGTPPTWSPLPITYTDYTLWKHEQLGEFTDEWSRATQQLRYWANALAGRPARLDLPTRVPPGPMDPTSGALLPISFDATTHAGLLRLAQEARASLFMVLQAAFAVTVGEFARSTDVTVATAVSGRDHRLLDDLVGNFSDDILMRVRLDRAGDVGELIDQVRRVALAAYAHPDTPNPRLKRCLLQDAALPLFQATLILQRADAPRITAEPPAAQALSITEVPIGVIKAKHDLEFGLTDHYDPLGAPRGVDGAFIYPLARFDEATARGFVARFRAVVGLLADGYRGPLPIARSLTTARRAPRVLV